jgi:hypothetical protein
MMILIKARRTSSPDVRLAHADDGAVATLHLDEAAADVCKRCSDIPWINGPRDSDDMAIVPFSPNCRICSMLMNCTLHKDNNNVLYKDSVLLAWKPAPEEIQRQLDEHKLQPRTIRVTTLYPPRNVHHDESTILVSDLSLEQAEMAFQLLSISPEMSLALIRDHIRDCVGNHGHTCALKEDRKPLHLRVIDCDTRTVVDAPTGCDFVALSYVWGKACDIQGFDITKDLPLTVEHSMYVTAELGFKYLWIDRYVSVIIHPTPSAIY